MSDIPVIRPPEIKLDDLQFIGYTVYDDSPQPCPECGGLDYEWDEEFDDTGDIVDTITCVCGYSGPPPNSIIASGKY